MRQSKFVALGLGTMLAWGTWNGFVVPSVVAQPPGQTAQVDPKILAFLKPVEIPDGDGPLQKKLKERHNVAVKLLEERVNEYKKGIRDASGVFEAARLAGEAKLDLAEGKDARIGVFEQLLEIAQLVENQLQEQLKKGFGARSDLERARLARLNL